MWNHPTQELDERGNFECLGHSHWTICSPSSPSCSQNFPTFSLSYWEANSYYPRGLIIRKGISPNFRNGRDKGISVSGTFKLDHLQLIQPILFWYFCTFYAFILGSPFLLPLRPQWLRDSECSVSEGGVYNVVLKTSLTRSLESDVTPL